MFYIDSTMTSSPTLMSNRSNLKDIIKRILIDGNIEIEYSAIRGGILIFNNGLSSHSMARYEFYDGKNSIISELEKINNNEYKIKSDISVLNTENIKIRYPTVTEWKYLEDPNGNHVFSTYFDAGFKILKEAKGFTVFRGGDEKTGILWSGAGYAVLYDGLSIILLLSEKQDLSVFTASSSIVSVNHNLISESIDGDYLRNSSASEYEKAIIASTGLRYYSTEGNNRLRYHNDNINQSLSICSMFSRGNELKRIKNYAGYWPPKFGVSKILDSGFCTIRFEYNIRLVIYYE